MKKFIYSILVPAIVLSGCAPNRNNPINAGYHDLTAHYNAYFIANEHIKEIEKTLHDSYQWNYNKMLPIYAPFDSTDASALKEQITDCIEKSSLAIQRHPESKWEYPSYVLVGKARFYGLEFPDAIETFKYVNTKSDNPNVRHEALNNLMRTFTVNREFNNALSVVDYLQKEEMSPKNSQFYYLNQAYLHQERGDLNLMVQNLVTAEELLFNTRDKARIQFIIGQIYQQLGFSASAFYYYEKSLKNNPSYELSFFTKLNMAQVTELSEGRDVKTIRKYFRKLLLDRKNFEYNDKIYFEMGVFEEKNEDLAEAIKNYKKSVKVSTNNNRQKGLSYLSLAKIYYDKIKNFELAKSYYDSTVTTLPKDEDNYAAIKARQLVLTEFVEHITTIRVNDSLISLSKLPPDSLRSWANQLVLNDSLQLAEETEKKRKIAKAQQQRRDPNTETGAELINTSSDGSWYFANPTSVSRGFSQFQRKWKNRILEDDWRRSIKIVNTTAQLEATESKEEEAPEAFAKVDVSTASNKDRVVEILGQIPDTEEKREILLDEIRDALYEVGNIYNFKLLEKDNAISTFELLLTRFPNSIYEPEVLYQLYLLQQESNPTASSAAANRLIRDFPESIYAKLINNPNYREETFATTKQLEKVYRKAYNFYEQNNYQASMALLDSALNLHPDNEFSDNLEILRILNIGHIEGQHLYQFQLDNFVKTYSESELLPYVQKLITGAKEYQAGVYSSSKAQYVKNFDQGHYFVLLYPNSKENSEIASLLIKPRIEDNEKSQFGNLLLSEEHSMAVVDNLQDQKIAWEFLTSLSIETNLVESFKGQKHFVFIITEENFDILYRTKDIESYRTFFEKYY